MGQAPCQPERWYSVFLYYNYEHGMLERTFIQDSYSC